MTREVLKLYEIIEKGEHGATAMRHQTTYRPWPTERTEVIFGSWKVYIGYLPWVEFGIIK